MRALQIGLYKYGFLRRVRSQKGGRTNTSAGWICGLEAGGFIGLFETADVLIKSSRLTIDSVSERGMESFRPRRGTPTIYPKRVVLLEPSDGQSRATAPEADISTHESTV